MIKIQKYNEVESDFYESREFGDSNEVVQSVLEVTSLSVLYYCV